MSDKTELPSPKRLRDARRKGNVARSRTLAAVVASLFAFGALSAAVPSVCATLHGYARSALLEATSGTVPVSVALARAWQTLLAASLPLLGAALLGGLVGSGLQVGLLFNTGAIAPKAERVDPGKGLARVFSGRSVVAALEAAVIAAVVLLLAWFALRDGARLVAGLPSLPAPAAIGAAFAITKGLLAKTLGAALALGAADYLYQRRAHLKGLMMSRQELKQEHKDSEGDPQHKARRKAAHRALLNGTAARGIQKATVLVINPTHVAVALRYDPREAPAPTLVAKGAEEKAAQLRWLARRFGVPMVRDVPLARALLRYDVGEEVPEELYQAAAVVLRKVYELGALSPELIKNAQGSRR